MGRKLNVDKIIIAIGNNKNKVGDDNNNICVGKKKGKKVIKSLVLPFVKRCFRYGAPLENTIDATIHAAHDCIKMFVCS